jgi:pyruvate/2-oxoglutarate dehydrogenase complex dihydrolipoamide dehydrogenase (E3) component
MAQTFARLWLNGDSDRAQRAIAQPRGRTPRIVQQRLWMTASLIFEATVKALKRTATGRIEFERAGKREQVEVDEILVSIGRRRCRLGQGRGVAYSDHGVTS